MPDKPLSEDQRKELFLALEWRQDEEPHPSCQAENVARQQDQRNDPRVALKELAAAW